MSTTFPSPTTDLATLADLLIPGRGADWPAVSAVVDLGAWQAALPPRTAARLAALAGTLAPLRQVHHIPAVSRFQAADPAAFDEIMGALTDAYYGTPEVWAITAALADAGPRPAAVPFDSARLDTVRTRGAAA